MNKDVFYGKYAAIKENRVKLDSCPRHHFDVSQVDFSKLLIGEKFTCTLCGGTMNATEASQYARGYEAAGGNPDEIIANFRGDDKTPVMCPQCKGVCGVETSVNVAESSDPQDVVLLPDWHDCDLCDAFGELPRADALAYLDEQRDGPKE